MAAQHGSYFTSYYLHAGRCGLNGFGHRQDTRSVALRLADGLAHYTWVQIANLHLDESIRGIKERGWGGGGAVSGPSFAD